MTVRVRHFTPAPGRLLIWASLGATLLVAAAFLVFSTGSAFAPAPPPAHATSTVNAIALPANGEPWITGAQGEAPGQFQQPRGVTVMADGSYVVVDRAARVQQFSATGEPLTLWSMKDHQFGNPKGLCALPDGTLLICDTHYGRLMQMTVTGEIVKQWGKPGLGPAEFTHPLSACVDLERKVAYVVEYGSYNDRVQKFSLDGTFIKMWGSFGSGDGQFQRPSGVAVDAAGNVYVADAVNHRVQKFDSEGHFLLKFGGEGVEPGKLRYPYDIALAADGHLYVAEFNNHRVSAFTQDGKFVRTLGSVGVGEGQFANPWSIAADTRGRLFVSDTGNHRVQVFDVKRLDGLQSNATVGNLPRQ
jgi:DNA-binding beta-propeller fold protein YncE